MPKLRYAKFETAIIERYKRRESSVEEALMEMYLSGVSVRRAEDITEALWGMKVGAGTVSQLNQKMYERIEAWRNEPIKGKYPYVYLDGISLKRTWGGEVKNVAILVAIGVGEDGYREVLGIAEGCKEDKAGWAAATVLMFQSTLPRGERQFGKYPADFEILFQSTLPRGERHQSSRFGTAKKKFQSTLPRGERRWRGCSG